MSEQLKKFSVLVTVIGHARYEVEATSPEEAYKSALDEDASRSWADKNMVEKEFYLEFEEIADDDWVITEEPDG